jgi:hypothetical protein
LLCEKANVGLEKGTLAGETYRNIQDECNELKLDDELCGFQTRSCIDVNSCGFTFLQPEDVQLCLYSLYPTCEDGIKNCHGGKCEFLVDCGGPCTACSTCSDGIRNQGEDEIDCGGPCPISCIDVLPTSNYFQYIFFELFPYNLLLFIILILIYLLMRKIRQVINLRREAAKKNKHPTIKNRRLR